MSSPAQQTVLEPTLPGLAELVPAPSPDDRPTADTTWLLDVFVPGRPAPQGSKHARPIYRGTGDQRVFTGKVATVESSKNGVQTWRADVRQAAETAWAGRAPLDAALVGYFEFVMPRPASTPKRSTPHATKRPDASKLLRSTEDALTSAGVYRDDSLLVDTRIVKRLAEIGEASGARIRIGVLA